MDKKTTSQEIGIRVRKFRMLKGWSQKELGDKIGTTSAAISKYEKEGVSHIDVIRDLSVALGVDLQNDEMDKEGEIGEIGLEILSILILGIENDNLFEEDDPNSGRVDADDLLNGEYLFGLSKERIIHELAKLENLGLCVREQFVDYDGESRDIVFITAKGIIAAKRKMPELDVSTEMKSYEIYCEDFSCVQECIDSNDTHKKIESLNMDTAFRYNFFAYITRSLSNREFSENKRFDNEFFPGINCYVDIMFSMMLCMNRKDADRLAMGKIEFEEEEMLSKLSGKEDYYIDFLLEWYPEHCRDHIEDLLMEYLGTSINKKFFIPATKEEREKMKKVLSDEEKRLNDILKPKIKEQDSFFKKYNKKVEELKKDGEKVDARKMFNYQQINSWVKENILCPKEEIEEQKQELMIELLERYYTAREYFHFPKEWEENGLAETIREAYGINEILAKHNDEEYDFSGGEGKVLSSLWRTLLYEEADMED